MGGNLRYLSHHETMDMFRRVLVRSGLDIYYSQGFNPRPKLSIPLPRSVAMVCHEELLTARVSADQSTDNKQCRERIVRQLPEGCELLTVEIVPGKVSYQPVAAEYGFAIPGELSDALEDKVERIRELLATGRSIVVKSTRCKDRDVAAFIESIGVENEMLHIKCTITPKGTIRTEEIFGLFGLEPCQLTGPVKRMSTQWNRN